MTHWSFHVSSTLPEGVVPTAVTGLVHWNGNIILVQTKRDWELPGGHIEEGETPEEALRRELFEEAGVSDISSFAMYGYKKIVNTQTKINKTTGVPYPREAYVPYYLVETRTEPTGSNAPDSFDSGLFGIEDEAINTSHDRDPILVGHGLYLYQLSFRL